MSPTNQTFRGSATTTPPVSPLVYNVPVALPATEYSQALTAGTKKFMIKTSGTAILRFGYAAGDSTTNPIVVPRGSLHKVDDINFTGTLYFQLSEAPGTVTIEEWS